MKRSDEELFDLLLSGERGVFDLLPVPVLLGEFRNGEPFVWHVNQVFREQVGAPPELPVSLAGAFCPAGRPFAPEAFLMSLSQDGWNRFLWEAIPGERIFDAAVLCRAEKGFLAVLPDHSGDVIVRRLERLESTVASILRTYPAREAFPPLLCALSESLDVDWAGILQWIPQEERWTLFASEENSFLSKRVDWALSFVDALLGEERCSGALLGGLAVEEGGQWWVPWVSAAGEAWKELLAGLGVASLFAGTLLTGSAPMVLLGFSSREGVFARLNRGALRALLPAFTSTAERCRMIAGLSLINDRDETTGLLSRGGLQRSLQQELGKAGRYAYPVSFVRISLNNAEEIRRAGGDVAFRDALRMIAGIAGQSIRTVDAAGRSGESTLLLVLPHTPLDGCLVVTNRIRERLEGVSPLPGVPLRVITEHASFAGGHIPSPEAILLGELFHP